MVREGLYLEERKTYNSIEEVEFPENVASLDIKNNSTNMKCIHEDALKNFVNLRKFDCFNNSGLRELPARLFCHTPLLKVFHCTDNKELSMLPENIFQCTKYLREFNFSKNNNAKGTLPAKLFHDTPLLKNFACTDNKMMDTLPGNIFARAEHLEYFCFSKNDSAKTMLSDRLFEKTRHLKHFICDGNRMMPTALLPEMLFLNTPRLKWFQYCEHDNAIGFPPKLFNNTPMLKEFRCNGNMGYMELPETLFSRTTCLKYFSCSQNQLLESLPPTLFKNTPLLKQFDCSHNANMKPFPENLFNNTRRLVYINHNNN